jgi:hypothetical protein
MENLKTALQLETSAHEYFSNLADKCHYNEGVRYILLMLAGEQKVLINSIEKQISQITDLAQDSDFFEKAKAVFYELKTKIDQFCCEIDHLNLYKHAQELMKQAHTLYTERESSEVSQDLKAFWKYISEEKDKQLILLDNIIGLLLRPEQWVESSEFTKLEEY